MKVPKYVSELISQGRLTPAPIAEQSAAGGVYGYVFRLYRLSNNQRDKTFLEEAKRLAAWASFMCAQADVLSYTDRDSGTNQTIHFFTEKEHRKPYYLRDFILVSITDPVALQIERLIKRS